MARYRVSFSALTSNGGANVFRTFVGLIAGAAKRGKLVSIDIGPAGEAPQDLDVSLRISTTNQAGAGTPASAPTPLAVDPGNPLVSVMTTGIDYTAGEPTTVHATPHELEVGFNSRGGYSKRFDDVDAPRWGASQTLVIQIAPGTGAAVKMSGTVVWEE